MGGIPDRQDLKLEPFSHGIRDPVGEVGQFNLQLLLTVFRGLNHRFMSPNPARRNRRQCARPVMPTGNHLLALKTITKPAEMIILCILDGR